MFKEETVFVLGAGSNKKEFNFPLGSELCEQIRALIEPGSRTVSEFTSAIAAEAGNNRIDLEFNEVMDAANIIRSGIDGKASIDDFIDAHDDKPHVKKMAKMAIAQTILGRESESGLRPDHDRFIDDVRITSTGWHDQLWRILTDGVRSTKLKEISTNPVSFVTFNYDRSLEQFLCIRLCQTYRCDPKTALEIVRELTVFHPYGTVGDFCFCLDPTGTERRYGDNERLFRRNDTQLPISKVAENILTYSEEVRDRASLLAIKKVMSEAKQIYFLGFGYHTQNLKLLYPTSSDIRPHTVEGTAVSISPQACIDLGNSLRRNFRFAGDDPPNRHLRPERNNEQRFKDFAFRMRRD